MQQSLCALLSLAFLVIVPGVGHATDLAAMQPPEIEALQKRLTEAGCYKGAIDGQASATTADAIKACPDQEPVLRLETGMHAAAINGVGFDAACRLVATASNDKTVRLWSLPEGHPIRTVRLPLALSPDDGSGRSNAVVLSPDGKTLLVGGWDAAYGTKRSVALYVVDLASGKIKRQGVFGNLIRDIALSPDGTRVAISLGAREGIRVLDIGAGQELMADRDYGGPSLKVAFGPDGSLFSTSYDGFIRRYGPNLTLATKVRALGGAQPFGIAVDTVGTRVGVGYADTSAVSILDAKSLKPIVRTTATSFSNGNLAQVVWSADGRQLIAGGSAALVSDGSEKTVLRRIDQTGKTLPGDTAVSDDTLHDLKRCGSTILFAASDPSFGLLDGRTVRTLQTAATTDMRAKLGNAFEVSTDGQSVRFGLGYGGKLPVLFDLAAGSLLDATQVAAALAPPTTGSLPLTAWQNNASPIYNGSPIRLDTNERAESAAIRSDRAGFVLGGEFSLRAFDATGKARWRRSLSNPAWGVNLSSSGDIIVSAQGDGTIRWHRWSDGQELLALFVNAKDRRWVAWTPTGYYMASPGGEDMIGWHVNRGWEQEADFFPASRFRDRFNRPDVVRLVLKIGDENEALKQADAAAGRRRNDSRPIIERLPPVITITSPSDGANAPPGTVEIRYTTRVPSGGAVERVEAFVDGAKVESRGLARTDVAPVSNEGSVGSVTMPMLAHDVVVSLVAYADGKASDAARVSLKSSVAVQASGTDAALKPSLYALVVGVSHYENKDFDLGYPAQDATGLTEALKAQEGKLYGHVEVKVLTDNEATQSGFKRGLLWLQKQTTARDLALVFAAGHGLTDAKGKFWFLTSDADPQALSVSAVSQGDITDVLYDLPGKKLLFLDACHSGAALNAGARGLQRTDASAAVNDFAQAEGGVVAYAASTGKEFSLERDEWGHGAFTKALIEGFGGKADLLHKGTITTATLDAYIAERVKELTGGAQHPVMTRPKTVPDFPIATIQ